MGIPSHPIVLALERDTSEPVALKSFFLNYEGLAAGLTTRVQLQPVPSDATFDANAVQLSFTGTIEGWTAMQQQRVANEPLSFDLTPQYPGFVQVQVTVGDTPVALLGETGGPLSTIEVGGLVDLQEGWQWRSNAYGDITADNIFPTFSGNQLVEARTQESLLYNDATWGYFGTIMETGIPQNTCYKVKMGSTPAPTILRGGHYVSGHSVLLDGEWTWVGVPYYFDRPIGEALDATQANLPDGMVIVSKEDGSAEFDGTTWLGDLTVLRRGQGIMVYSPLDVPFHLTFAPEANMTQGAPVTARAKNTATMRWHYDASRFMNNTSIVAVLSGMESLSDEWSVGVFVGDECRGEGHYVDGYFFITAHTERGEAVSLRLRHEPTGRTFAIDGTIVTGQMRIGSLAQPLVLQSAEAMLGIDERRTDREGKVDCYDMLGRRITSAAHRGILLQRRADGTVRKVLAH